MVENGIKKTILHDWHTNNAANMASFGGYDMPLWYSGPVDEHLTVVSNAGMFDTSHMAVVIVKGKGAVDVLQYCFTRDLTACVGKKRGPLKRGYCVYGMFLNNRGEVIDDAIVYQIADGEYMVVVNSGMGSVIANHLKDHVNGGGVVVDDLTDKVGKFDIQGPLSARVLKRVLKDPEMVFESLSYFKFKGHFARESFLAGEVELIDGTPLLLSRTGYTGEFGFEIFVEPEHFLKTWELVADAGRDMGLLPCGLAARDSLRTGAMLPLSHRDIGPWPFINNPWTFALPFSKDATAFTKEFLGYKALMNLNEAEYTYAFTGFDPRKVGTHAQAMVLDDNGARMGIVLTCATDMAIGHHNGMLYSIASPDKPEGFKPRGLSCGFIKVHSKMECGQVIELKDNKRALKAMIASDIRPARTARRPIKNML